MRRFRCTFWLWLAVGLCLAGSRGQAADCWAAGPTSVFRGGEGVWLQVGLSGMPPKLDLRIRAEVTYPAGGTRVFHYGPQGKPADQPQIYRPNFAPPGATFFVGPLTAPDTAPGAPAEVVWVVNAAPTAGDTGPQVEGRFAAQLYSQSLAGLAGRVYQAWFARSGVAVWAEVSDEGRKLQPHFGPAEMDRFWNLPGTKLILIHGLSCSHREWFNSVTTLIRNGAYPAGTSCLPAYQPLMKHYAAVAAFEYPGLYPIPGPRLAGALAEVMAAAPEGMRVDLLGHSQGGMIGRYYVEKLGGAAKVANLVTICSPLGGVSTPDWQQGRQWLVSWAKLLCGPAAGPGDLVPIADMVSGSRLLTDLNRPWQKLEPPCSRDGFGPTRYYCVATGVFGSGRSPHRAAGWSDCLPGSQGREIRATSALYLPLGSGPEGRPAGLAELDASGEHELLVVSPAPAADRPLLHAIVTHHLADDTHTGIAKWLTARLWP